MQFFRPFVVERAKLQALGTFLHVFGTVALDIQPVVVGFQDFSDHRPRPRVISTDSLVDLGQNVLGSFAGDALQQGGRVSFSVQVFIDHGVSGTLMFHRFFLVWLACPVLQVLDDGYHPVIGLDLGLVYCKTFSLDHTGVP